MCAQLNVILIYLARSIPPRVSSVSTAQNYPLLAALIACSFLVSLLSRHYGDRLSANPKEDISLERLVE
jgi:hypothetical protein